MIHSRLLLRFPPPLLTCLVLKKLWRIQNVAKWDTRATSTYVCRQANGVAHFLSRCVLYIGLVLPWFEEPSDYVVDFLFENCL